MPTGIIQAGSSILGVVSSMGAASAKNRAIGQASAFQQQAFDQIYKALEPYRAIGTEALNKLHTLVLGTPAEVQTALESAPGYSAGLKAGQKAIETGASAKSKFESGATKKELMKFGIDYSNQQFDKEVARVGSVAQLGFNATTAANTATGANAGAQSNLAIGRGSVMNDLFKNLNTVGQQTFANIDYRNQLKDVLPVPDIGKSVTSGAAAQVPNVSIPFG